MVARGRFELPSTGLFLTGPKPVIGRVSTPLLVHYTTGLQRRPQTASSNKSSRFIREAPCSRSRMSTAKLRKSVRPPWRTTGRVDEYAERLSWESETYIAIAFGQTRVAKCKIAQNQLVFTIQELITFTPLTAVK